MDFGNGREVLPEPIDLIGTNGGTVCNYTIKVESYMLIACHISTQAKGAHSGHIRPVIPI